MKQLRLTTDWHIFHVRVGFLELFLTLGTTSDVSSSAFYVLTASNFLLLRGPTIPYLDLYVSSMADFELRLTKLLRCCNHVALTTIQQEHHYVSYSLY